MWRPAFRRCRGFLERQKSSVQSHEAVRLQRVPSDDPIFGNLLSRGPLRIYQHRPFQVHVILADYKSVYRALLYYPLSFSQFRDF